MKTNLELIKELPGIKFARQYTPQKDTRGEIFLVEFEPEAPEGKKRVLFTNSLGQDFFEGDKVWWFHKPTFELLSRNINYIDEDYYSECVKTSELYKTEADAYRRMIRYAAKQGKLIEKNTDLGWVTTTIFRRRLDWWSDIAHPENVYRIAKKVDHPEDLTDELSPESKEMKKTIIINHLVKREKT